MKSSTEQKRQTLTQTEELLKTRTQELYLSNLELQETTQTLEQRIIDRTVELVSDQHDLQHLVEERSRELMEAQRQLFQAEKLASVGQLAAGVAHEINTPIQYIGDNLHALEDMFRDLVGLLTQYEALARRNRAGESVHELLNEIADAEKACDLNFILEDAPKAISQGLEGVSRVANIVRAMKDFSHVGRDVLASVDLNHALESTLTIARNEYKYFADVRKELGAIPAVECFAGQINQVFLNLIVNAAHAIEATGERGVITVCTKHVGADVEIAISDTGVGIPQGIRHRIFDPFFTTKEVGKGTGQGLTLVHQVIAKHGGNIAFDTEVGKGSTFRVRLPIVMCERLKKEAGGDVE